MNQAYLVAVKEHSQDHVEALEDLAVRLQQRSLDFHERNSAERSVQVLVETLIGLSKHVCKKAGQQTLGNAATNALKALEMLSIQPFSPKRLQGAIGMRNTIVHDYLNLDWQLLQQVIEQRQFKN